MLEVDPPPLFYEQPVNLRNIRMCESGKKSRSSRQLQYNSSSIPGHDSDACGHPDAKKRNSSSRRNTQSGSPQQRSPRNLQRMDKSHHSSKQVTLSTTAASDDLPTGLILKSPKTSSRKSCQDHNNNTKDNGYIHPTSATTNHPSSTRETRSSSCIRARQAESPRKKVPPQAPSTPTRSHRSSTRSTRSNLHDSQNAIHSTPSPSGDSGDSIPSQKRITPKKDERTDCKSKETAAVRRAHKSSSTRKPKTKSNGHDTKQKPSPRKELAKTKRKDGVSATENRPKVDDDDDKENSRKMSGNEGAYENTVMRPDHQQSHAMQSRSGVATRKIEKYMESTPSLKESATVVSPTAHRPQETHRKQRQSSSSPGKVKRSNKVIDGGSVEDLIASSPGKVKRSNKVVDGDSEIDVLASSPGRVKRSNKGIDGGSVEDLIASSPGKVKRSNKVLDSDSTKALRAVKSLDPVVDTASSMEPSSPRNLTTSPSPTSKRKHRRHQKHSRKSEHKSGTASDSATKTLVASANQQDRVSSRSISDPSKSSDVTSLHPGTTQGDGKAKNTTHSRRSIVDDQQITNEMMGSKDNNRESVQENEVQFLLAHSSGCNHGSANDHGLSKTHSIQETDKLNRKLEESTEPTKVCQNVQASQCMSPNTHIVSEHPTCIKQYDEEKEDHSFSLGASGASIGKEGTRPDLQIGSNLTYPDSGKECSIDEPSSMENTNASTLGVFQRILSIPTTMRRWNHKQKSRSFLRRASKSLSYRSTTLLSLRQFEEDFLDVDKKDDDDNNDNPPSRRCSRLERARSESVLLGGQDPWFYNNATTAMNNDSIASMEMVFFFSDNDENNENPTE